MEIVKTKYHPLLWKDEVIISCDIGKKKDNTPLKSEHKN